MMNAACSLLLLLLLLPPISRTAPMKEVSMDDGDDVAVTLECRSGTGKRESTRLSWIRVDNVTGIPEVIVTERTKDFQRAAYQLENDAGKNAFDLKIRSSKAGNAHFYCMNTVPQDGQTVVMHYALIVKTKPTVPRIDSPWPSSVVEGDWLRTTCSSDGGNPAPKFFWQLDDGTQLPGAYQDDGRFEANLTSYSHVLVVASRNYHRRSFVCEIWSKALDDFHQLNASTLPLNILYRPRVTIEPAKDVYDEGDQLSLHCHVDANPDAVMSLWFHPGGNGSNDGEKTLKISSLDRSNSGWYACLAKNSVGEDSASVHVDVLYKPRISILQKGVAVEGGDVQLVCVVDANPPANVSWENGADGIVDDADPTRVILRLLRIRRPMHERNYTCEAANTLSMGIATVRTSVHLRINAAIEQRTAISSKPQNDEHRKRELPCIGWSCAPLTVCMMYVNLTAKCVPLDLLRPPSLFTSSSTSALPITHHTSAITVKSLAVAATSKTESDGVAGWVIALLVIAIVLVIVVAVVIFCCCLRSRRRKAERADDDASSTHSSTIASVAPNSPKFSWKRASLDDTYRSTEPSSAEGDEGSLQVEWDASEAAPSAAAPSTIGDDGRDNEDDRGLQQGLSTHKKVVATLLDRLASKGVDAPRTRQSKRRRSPQSELSSTQHTPTQTGQQSSHSSLSDHHWKLSSASATPSFSEQQSTSSDHGLGAADWSSSGSSRRAPSAGGQVNDF